MRIGHGIDTHKFGGNNPLIICGVKIPYKKGLISHSDGDVALHALIDAMLGAASLGDIGNMFPNKNKKFKQCDSRILLKYGYSQIMKNGLFINNIDITIITEEPKISPYIFKMKKNISKDLKCNINSINIKSTTNERLGFIGRKEGITCTAVISLKKQYLKNKKFFIIFLKNIKKFFSYYKKNEKKNVKDFIKQ